MSNHDTSDRELTLSRLIDAPRPLVFEAWSDVKHVSQWWGPNGFTTTTKEFDFRPGGKWVYTMHGPDGTDFPNWIQYRTIIPNELLVYDHGGSAGGEDVAFEGTITFADEAGKTRVTLRSLFPTAEALRFVVENFGAREGGEQHLANLDSYVQSLKS